MFIGVYFSDWVADKTFDKDGQLLRAKVTIERKDVVLTLHDYSAT